MKFKQPDSKQEAKNIAYLASLGFIRRSDYLQVDLFDQSNTAYKAQVDFVNDKTGITLELKSPFLNHHETRAATEGLYDKQRANPFNAGKTDRYIELWTKWNHSLLKHSQQALRSAPLTHIMVFTSPPAYWLIKLLIKNCIVWTTISRLEDFLKALFFVRVGFECTINYRFSQQEVSMPLRSIKRQLEAIQSKVTPDTKYIKPVPFLSEGADKKAFKAAGVTTTKPDF